MVKADQSIPRNEQRKLSDLLGKNVPEVAKCMLDKNVVVLGVNLRHIKCVNVCRHCRDNLSQLRNRKQNIHDQCGSA